MAEYQILWGDTHHNTYQSYVQDPPLDGVLSFAARHLDFYTGAYYTAAFQRVPPLPKALHAPTRPEGGGHPLEQSAAMSQFRGINLEDTKEGEAMAREWAQFQAIIAAAHEPGRFVAFPGYEWQGNGQWGDHNVIYRQEGMPIHAVDTLPQLYARLRGLDAIAIPHHTAYHVGHRAPAWSACNEDISPFAEIFSIHGCSESDEEWIGLRRNCHMGPGVGGGTYQEALDAGLHLGAICSTDNWSNMPGHWGQGLAACLAADRTRSALWEAFRARRVYGVTGDRIALDFTLNGAPMGAILPFSPQRHLRVSVRGWEALDRIEILRNGRVLATHCHQGTWGQPQAGQRARFVLRVEAGWGADPGQVPMPDRHWQGEIWVEGGRFIRWSPCWVTRDQGVPTLERDTARFELVSRQSYVTSPMQGATAFEVEADPAAEMVVRINGLVARDKVASFAARSRLLWYREDSVALVRQTTGVEPAQAARDDVYFHLANKAKLHKAIPEAGFAAQFEIVDDEPLTAETHYRVRVEQRNGQRAWSSPIWVAPPEAEG